MNRLISICAGLLLSVTAYAQSTDLLVVRSRTDQFFVYGAQSAHRPGDTIMRSVPLGQGQLFWQLPQQRTNESARVHLTPSMVAVSCERIKEAFLRELGEKDSGGRKVHIQLNPRASDNDIGVVAMKYPRGWVYSLELPVDMESQRFTAAILEVLVLELANRHSGDQQVELPRWLLSGLISHLRAARLETLTLQANIQIARSRISVDPVAGLRERFQQNMPLTFEEMSWPGNLPTNRVEVFQDSTQLFVHELLRLNGGRENMRRFIQQLPAHRNWQFAFLTAYQTNFTKLIDVEKWWALRFASYTGRDPNRLWSHDESWAKLKSALDVPVQIHLKNDRMPVPAQLTLQEVIQTWDVSRQEATFQKSIQQLRSMRTFVQPEFVELVDGYRRVLESYLEQRGRIGRSTQHQKAPVNGTVLRKSISSQLDSLDEQRAKLRSVLLSGGN